MDNVACALRVLDRDPVSGAHRHHPDPGGSAPGSLSLLGVLLRSFTFGDPLACLEKPFESSLGVVTPLTGQRQLCLSPLQRPLNRLLLDIMTARG